MNKQVSDGKVSKTTERAVMGIFQMAIEAIDNWGIEGAREYFTLMCEGLEPDEIMLSVRRYENAPALTRQPKTAPVIDLLCWRQSHPRPLKGGAR